MIYHILKENSRYAVYGNGTIYDIKRDKIVKSHKLNNRNSDYVFLYNKDTRHSTTYSLAKLVAQYFVFNSNPKVYKCVEHINGNSSDNRPSNLRWCKRNKVGGASKRCKPVLVYNKYNGNFVAEFSSLKEVSSWLRKQGAGKYVYTMVSQVLTGRRTSYYGYIYKYKNSKQAHQVSISARPTLKIRNYTFNNKIENGSTNCKSEHIKDEALHILMYSAGEHKIRHEFNDMNDAVKWLMKHKGASKHVSGNISGCLHGYQKTCFGYVFKYRYPDIASKYRNTMTEKQKTINQQIKEKIIKPIFQYDLNGNLVRSYNNIYDVIKSNSNFKYSGLYSAIYYNTNNGKKRTYKNY